MTFNWSDSQVPWKLVLILSCASVCWVNFHTSAEPFYSITWMPLATVVLWTWEFVCPDAFWSRHCRLVLLFLLADKIMSSWWVLPVRNRRRLVHAVCEQSWLNVNAFFLKPMSIWRWSKVLDSWQVSLIPLFQPQFHLPFIMVSSSTK